MQRIRAAGILLAAALGAQDAAGALAPPQPGPPAEADGALKWRAFRSFGSADGLPQNSVLALLQDRDGFVYAGTLHGLARYDGRRWQTVSLPTAGRSYAVGALAQGRDGALWIGTDGVGAWRLHAGRPERVALPPGAAEVNAFGAWGEAGMWVAAGDGLYRCARQCTRVDGIAAEGARTVLQERRDGRDYLWVGTNDEGALELTDLDAARPTRTGVRLSREEGLPNRVALSLVRFGGDLWIGSGRGLARYDGRRLTVYGAANGFPAAMVFGLLPQVDERGAPVLLAALRPGGLAEIRPDGRWRLLDGRHGLPANAVHSLLRERGGAVWLGTMGGGVARIERERWTVFDERMGLPERIVVGVGWSAARAELWAGTARGAVRWEDGRFVPLLPPPHQQLLVYDLLDAPDGTRWIAHGRGLQRWRDQTLLQAFDVDGSALPAVSADRLALRRAGDDFELYVGTGHGLARWRAADGLQQVDATPAFAQRAGVRALASVPDAARARHDVLFVLSDLGLHRLDAQGWRELALDCPDAQAVFALAAEATHDGEALWLAARSGLQRRAADGRCVAYPATRAVGALTEVRLHDGALWVFGARGALRLALAAGPDAAGQLFGADAGLAQPEIARAALDGRGRVFGATAAGLAALAPAAPAPPAGPAPLHLLQAQWGARGRPLEEHARLPPDDSAVRFEFALLALEREHALRYRTRLEGLEARFSPWRSDTALSYPHLPPGRYRLQVEARDADGVRAAPLGFEFSVAAPWWQHPALALLGAAALVAAGLAVGRWRSRAARRRAVELESEVAARTAELAEANARLEQAAITDPLTGLRNRRWFALAAPAEAERARRAPAAQALLLALLDIDHFKRINDTHGHEAGDAVLVEVARRLQRVARGGDFVLRWGGEEFLLLLRDVERAHAGEVLQRLLQELEATPVSWQAQALPLTASIGALCYPPSGAPAAPSLEAALAQADAALYRAKREGRARALLLGDEPGAEARVVQC